MTSPLAQRRHPSGIDPPKRTLTTRRRTRGRRNAEADYARGLGLFGAGKFAAAKLGAAFPCLEAFGVEMSRYFDYEGSGALATRGTGSVTSGICHSGCIPWRGASVVLFLANQI